MFKGREKSITHFLNKYHYTFLLRKSLTKTLTKKADFEVHKHNLLRRWERESNTHTQAPLEYVLSNQIRHKINLNLLRCKTPFIAGHGKWLQPVKHLTMCVF
jgi:hypothetical protein